MAVLDGTKFALMQSDSCGEPMVWKRFKSCYYNDYFYLSTHSFDGIIFKPLVNIMFHGFGILAHYNQNNCKYIIQWALDGEKSEEYLAERSDGDKDPEHKWHTISIREDFGVKPFKVLEG